MHTKPPIDAEQETYGGTPSAGGEAAPGGVPSWAVPAVLMAVTVLCMVTMRPGHSWHDDFALYVLHARNLVEGLPYGATGYIYNPADPMHSPQNYPPGFPLLLAPVYALFGLNFFALGLVVLASFVGALAAFSALVRPLLTPRLHLAAVALVGFQPFLLRFRSQLLPDLTFVLLVFVSLLLLRRLHAVDRQRESMLTGIAAGACMAAAVSMRVVGVALFAGLALYHVVRLRVPGRGVIAAVITPLILLGVQALAMPPASGYVAQIADMESAGWSPRRRLPFRSVVRFFSSLRVMWAPRGDLWALNLTGIDKTVALYATMSMTLLASIGFVARLRRISTLETFAIAYSAVLVYWGFISARYIVPLVPFAILYCVIAVRLIMERGRRPGRVAALLIGGVATTLYVASLARLQTGPYSRDVTSAPAQEMYAWVSECTPADARLAARRPRALALFTRREAMTFTGRPTVEPDVFRERLGEGAITHVVTVRGGDWDELAARVPELVPAFSNAEFSIYAMPGAEPPACSPRPEPARSMADS